MNLEADNVSANTMHFRHSRCLSKVKGERIKVKGQKTKASGISATQRGFISLFIILGIQPRNCVRDFTSNFMKIAEFNPATVCGISHLDLKY